MKIKCLFLCACLLLTFSSTALLAQGSSSAGCNLVYFFNAFAPATAVGASNGVVYGLLVNLSGQADTLLDASSDAAQSVELHQSSMDSNGVMSMTPLPNGIAV